MTSVSSIQVSQHRKLSIGLIVGVGLLLYVPGINWGLPGIVSWSQDSIGATRTTGAVTGWPDHWLGRYPPAHYLLLYSAYQPILSYWTSSGQLQRASDSPKLLFKPPHEQKIGVLLLIARCISVLFAIGTGIGLWCAARAFNLDWLSSLLAALTMMIGACFTYFAHLSNVDMPSLCWLSWSLYFYARLLTSPHGLSAAMLGVCTALAVATKDSAAGMLGGMAVVLLVNQYTKHRKHLGVAIALRRALLHWHWLIGLTTFFIVYASITDLVWNTEAYLARLRYWVSPTAGTLHAAQHRYESQGQLLVATFRYTASAVGWPMLIAMGISVIYIIRHRTKIAFALLIPAIGYYLIVIMPIGFVYARFLLPPLLVVSICMGITFATFIQNTNMTSVSRAVIVAVIFLPTLGYSIAVDAEMITDSRYKAEHWFKNQIDTAASVGAFSMNDKPRLRPQYLPRLHELGYATYPVVMKLTSFSRPQPDFLVLTNYNYEDYDEQQHSCMRKLLAGDLGYDVVAQFERQYLGDGSSWLSLAGWGTPHLGKISPTLIVLQRRDQPPP